MARFLIFAGTLILLAVIGLSGCKKPKECSDVVDCAPEESCLYLYQTKDMRCALICKAHDECEGSLNCLPGAKTCPDCADTVKICK